MAEVCIVYRLRLYRTFTPPVNLMSRRLNNPSIVPADSSKNDSAECWNAPSQFIEPHACPPRRRLIPVVDGTLRIEGGEVGQFPERLNLAAVGVGLIEDDGLAGGPALCLGFNGRSAPALVKRQPRLAAAQSATDALRKLGQFGRPPHFGLPLIFAPEPSRKTTKGNLHRVMPCSVKDQHGI